MRPNGDPVMVTIRVRVYPGIFDGENQVTISTDRGEIHLNVSSDFVEVRETPTKSGVMGHLKVNVVKENGGQYIVALPGEVQGTFARVAVPKGSVAVSVT